jgi:hypothetical protein
MHREDVLLDIGDADIDVKLLPSRMLRMLLDLAQEFCYRLCNSPIRLRAIETTGAFWLPSKAAAIWLAMASEARRRGSLSRCA